jgi:hypothetical protein
MVILKLKGGLGNQLFQYAAARQIASNNGVELIIDSISGFKRDPFRRENLLNYFPISAKFNIINFENKIYNCNYFYYKIYNLIQRLLPLKYRFYIKESEKIDFDSRLRDIKLTKTIYLEGYFQSYLYFDSISEIIKREFIFTGELGRECKQFYEEINMSESVSIHLRSFNVGKLNDTSLINGNCSLEFYESAINHILVNIKTPKFFIFSDDIEWAKKTIDLLNINFEVKLIYYSDNLDHSIEDFVLMSECKYNIIANSTFSWWAAWLNKNPNKIIIAPSNWFVSRKVSNKSIYPNSWIVI